MTNASSYFRVAALSLCALLCLGSCSRETAPERRETVGVTFEVGLAHSRADLGPDASVSTLDILIFRSATGSVEGHVRGSGTRVNAEVLKGVQVDCRAVANAPEGAFASVRTLDDYLSTLCRLDDNAPQRLVMTGGSTFTFTASGTAPLDLSRLVSKVTLTTLTPVFLGYAYAGSEVHLKGACLINAVGSVPYAGTATAGDLWYNRMACDPALAEGLRALLVKDMDVELTDDNPVDLSQSFYVCPNPVSNDDNALNAPLWSPRSTRLVLEVEIGGLTNYYPVTLPAMEGNTEYRITDLRLLGPGSSNPDLPVSRQVIDYTVMVNPWGEVSQPLVMDEDVTQP